MPTANTIIADALGLIGVVDPTDAVAAEDASLGLRVLNRVIDSLGIEPSMALVVTFQAVPLVAGSASKTIGPSADVNVSCPVRIETGAYVRVGDIDYPLAALNREQWAELCDKATQTGTPGGVYFEPLSTTQARLNFWPIPDAICTAYLPLVQRVSQFAELTTNITLRDGYEEAFVTHLALALAPFYGREAPASVVHRSRVLKREIKRLNAQVPQLNTDEFQSAMRGRWLLPAGHFPS